MEQHCQSTTLPQFRPRRPTSKHGRGQKNPSHENHDGWKRDPAPPNVYIGAHLISSAENGNTTTACSNRICHRLREAFIEVWQTGRILVVEPVETLHDIGGEARLAGILLA